MKRELRLIIGFSMMLLGIAACGGAGNEQNAVVSPPVQPPPTQTLPEDKAPTEQAPLYFETDVVTVMIDIDAIENDLFGGSGDGVLTWASSNNYVASIDATSGKITLHEDGQTTITVIKAADDTYASSEASFELFVEKYRRESISFKTPQLDLILFSPVVNNELLGTETFGDDSPIRYWSDNPGVAAVDKNSGALTINRSGSTTIRALIVENNRYSETALSYDVTIFNGITKLNSEISAEFALLTWADLDIPVTLTTAQNRDCYSHNLNTCTNAMQYHLEPSSDNRLELHEFDIESNLFLTFEFGEFQSVSKLASQHQAPYGPRQGASMIEFNDRLWLIGGYRDYWWENLSIHVEWFNDIWSSEDGLNWQRETESAEFKPRGNFQVVKYRDHLYLIGGDEGYGTQGALTYKRDVWRSSDGIHWQRILDQLPFTTWQVGEAIVFQDRIYLVGGAAFADETRSVYSSTDGINWQVETVYPPFGNIENHELYVVDNKMLLFGGFQKPSSLNINNLIYSTIDGKNWHVEATDEPVKGRFMSTVVELRGKYYLIGGTRGGPNLTTQLSMDGINWSPVPREAVADIAFYNVVNFKGKLILSPGTGERAGRRNAKAGIWTSNNGINWTQSNKLPIEWRAASPEVP